MGERLTWEEIAQKYPNQWVGLVDVEWEDESNVRTAIVKYTDKSSTELALTQLEDGNIYCAYTTPNNLGQLGIVGYMS